MLGTMSDIPQPKNGKCIGHLPTVLDLYPDMKKHEGKKQGPSCGLLDAINKQNLFVNSVVSVFALDLLDQGFRTGKITTHGAFINLKTCKAAPMLISPSTWAQKGWSANKAQLKAA